ncbi:MFS transporter [Oligella urethralis]|uniref:Muropeptide transporter n=1 Tax=Oligella urethralis TaxID=90245 RepID=A0A2X1UQI6_9BURK|nr:MFS transporter [Oligella urethralis]SPY09356.1 muropeptide transporter [Oligella urethralis]
MSQSASRNPWFMLIMVYITQYIGISFLFTGGIVIFRTLGVPLEQLSLVFWVMLPIALRLIFSLFVDKVSTFLQGHYRGWLLIAQMMMTTLLVVISFIDPLHRFYWMLGLFFVYAIFTGIQDVSVDGLVCKIFPTQKRQQANALQYAGSFIGNAVGGGVVLMFYQTLGWQGSLLFLASLTMISVCQITFYREPAEAVTPLSKEWVSLSLWAEFKSFIKRHVKWLLFLLVAAFGISFFGCALKSLASGLRMVARRDWFNDESVWLSYRCLIGLISYPLNALFRQW